MVRSRLTFVVVASLAALALTGCAPALPTAGPTASATVTPSATPTPTPIPTKPTLAQLVVSPDGLGYLVPAQPVPNEPAATAIMRYDPTNCVSPGGVAAGSPGAGAWIPNYPDADSALGSRMPFDVGPVDNSTAPIHAIEVWSAERTTAKHIGVGSTVAELTAAYGSSLTVDAADNSDVYVLRGSASELLFEVAKPDSGLPAAAIGTVVWMRIVPIDEAYLHIANTDAAGPCSI